MDRQSEFYKALRLLDKGVVDRAVELLKEINVASVEEDDTLYIVKTSCVLGEYYLSENQTEVGRGYLKKVIDCSEADEDIRDILDYEISRAEELLNEIQ